MAFNILIYSNTAEENKLDKSNNLTLLQTIECDPYGEMNMMGPSFILDSNVDVTGNYAYVEKFGRYYFIDDIVFSPAKIRILMLKEDVLYTWRGRVADVTFNFIRGGDKISETEDPNYPLADVLEKEHFDFANWDSSFFTNSDAGQRYMLRVADGKAKEWDVVATIEIGTVLCYADKQMEVAGSFSGAYIANVQDISGGDPAGSLRVANGDILTISAVIAGVKYTKDYRFVQTFNPMTDDYIFTLDANTLGYS